MPRMTLEEKLAAEAERERLAKERLEQRAREEEQRLQAARGAAPWYSRQQVLDAIDLVLDSANEQSLRLDHINLTFASLDQRQQKDARQYISSGPEDYQFTIEVTPSTPMRFTMDNYRRLPADVFHQLVYSLMRHIKEGEDKR